MNRLLILSVVLLMVSAIGAKNVTDLNVDDLKNALPEGVTLPSLLENVTIPTADDAKKLFKEKCNKVSGSDAAYDEASEATATAMECVQGLVNFETLQTEISDAKPHGNLDTVFNKYCKKRDQAMDCITNFTKSIEPCLTKEEAEQKVVFTNIANNLLNFVCHKDGDQIALFIAENGPECFSNKSVAIQNCMNETFKGYVQAEMPTIDNLPNLVLGEKECMDMDKLQICIVEVLEKCSESTPANLVESLFKFVRKETPCNNFTSIATAREQKSGNASDMNKLSINVLIGTWLMALMAKFLVSSC
ncbi:unnamed protein product [Diamesa hyperborea]